MPGIQYERSEQEKVVELIKECDINNDGVTSFQEFLYILRRFSDGEQQDELVEIRNATKGDFEHLPGHLKPNPKVSSMKTNAMPDFLINEINELLDENEDEYAHLGKYDISIIKILLKNIGVKVAIQDLKIIEKIKNELLGTQQEAHTQAKKDMTRVDILKIIRIAWLHDVGDLQEIVERFCLDREEKLELGEEHNQFNGDAQAQAQQQEGADYDEGQPKKGAANVMNPLWLEAAERTHMCMDLLATRQSWISQRINQCEEGAGGKKAGGKLAGLK